MKTLTIFASATLLLAVPAQSGAAPVPPSPLNSIIPMPAFVSATGSNFALTANANIYIEPATPEIKALGQFLADKLRPSTGYALPVLSTTGAPANGNIYLTTKGSDPTLGQEGYNLTVSPDLLTLSAHTPAGLFRGIQTIRQLLPAAVESATRQSGPWGLETGVIRDTPRFAWRGFMLDVARHFFSVDEVKRVIDLMAYYKLNHLHLHLSDDQGWRLAISGWPNLTTTGGSTQVGGGTGGFYTQDDYSAIVKYAQARYISVVPEIDMPGHSSAALASYPELTCAGVAPAQNTDTIAQSASLCVGKDITYSFVGDVVKELAELTPGPYIHIGGDEPSSTRPSDYLNFVNRVQAIVKTNDKQVIGWQDISQSTLLPDTVIQHWNWDQRAITLQGVQQGAMVIMSPVPLGERYAGYVSVQAGYQWEPSLQIKGLTESSILGVEAPLWTEIVSSRADLDRMTYPWLLAYAEIGWSPPTGRNWDEYKARLGTHGPRLTALGVGFFRSTEVPWQ